MPATLRALPLAATALALLGLAGWLGVRSPLAGTAGIAGETPGGQARAGRVFLVDADGRLVIDQRTRLALAALVAVNPCEQILTLMEPEWRRLPPAAAATARELTQRYCDYDQAARELLPHPLNPPAADERLAELAALSSLRIAYFGNDVARRMFGDEEALSWRLLEQGASGRVPLHMRRTPPAPEALRLR